jgi:hypothetical protein
MKIISEARKREREPPPIIRARLLKRRRREVKVDPMLGGPWNVKENTFSPLQIPPNNFTLNLQFFPLTLRFILP